MSFKLEDLEVRYNTTEKEGLAVVRCLIESKYFIIGHPYPVILYTNYEALETILRVNIDDHGRITRQIDRLIEYNYIIYYRPYKSNLTRIANGLSRMPRYYSQYAYTEYLERLQILVAIVQVKPTEQENRVLENIPNLVTLTH